MEALSEILDFNDASAEDDKNKAIYHNAIVQIQHSIYNGPALPRTLWPVFVSDDYLTLLKQQRPMALIILAHGCVLAKYAPYRWFVHNWSVHITSSIAKVIDPVLEPRMSWPLKEWGLPYEGIGDCTPVLSKA
ncbi:hypothetical protein B0J14DRAFT_685904 [Halenospora varia]|nr:hypothetical protein B0J14DRAFT_685904 [Halenospora varia]